MIDFEKVQFANQVVVSHPLFGILITFMCFQSGRFLFEKTGRFPLFFPLLTAAILLIFLLKFFGLSYQRYFDSVEVLHWLLGTVTVGLAVPLYESLRRLRSLFFPVFITVISSAAFAVFIVVVLARVLGLDEVFVKSLATKSVTTPIAVSLSEEIGGKAALATFFVLVTGLFGPIFVPLLLKIFPARNDAISGIAIGVPAHAIGTAKALEISRECGAFAALAMSLMGLITALFCRGFYDALFSPLGAYLIT
ncbi:MAG: LrgB family protein [Pseudomonadales bacterium]|nr:LrgB family protein [Pseudomonadales bacterium]